MKMKKQVLLWLAPVMLVAGLISGCANDGGGSVDEGIPGPVIPPRDSTTFRVSPTRISLAKGAKQQFKAWYNNKEASLVEWAVSGSGGGSKFGKDADDISTGELEVSSNESADILKVSASLTINGKKFAAQALVTVLGNGDVPLEHGLTVSPGVVVVGKGASQTFTARLSATGDAETNVSWTVSGGGSGTGIGGTSGLLTVAEGETAEKLLVTAKLNGNADKSGTAVVYVGSAPEGSGPFPENHGIAVKPPEATLDKGEEGSFTATGDGLGLVAWSLEGNKAAAVITDGVFTVAQNETAEKIAVKAVSGTKWGQAVVTVRGNESPPAYGPVVDGLVVEPQEASVAKGKAQTFTVKGYEGNVSWTVRGGKSGITATGGLLSVVSGETAKYLVVRAEASDGKNGTAVVTVTESGSGSGSGSGEPQPATVTMTVTPNGSSTATTTGLTLDFSPGIADLSADEITIEPGSTGAAKGALSGSDGSYTLGLSGITAGGNITVTVSKSGYSISGSPATVTVYKRNPVNSPYAPEMLPVEGGSMTLNGTNVTLSSFWISNHEVTQKEWYDVMGTTIQSQNNISDYKGLYGVGDNYPMYHVNWYEAAQFCNKLSENEGLNRVYNINGTDVTLNDGANGYRLPTEAEWEYAARGGQQSLGSEYSGASNVDAVAWYADNSGSSAHPVGGKMANELGLYDMSGNVWEWCWDWYGTYPSSTNNPMGASSGSNRVLRGGSWYDSASVVCSAHRINPPPSYRGNNVGFRVARSAAP